MKRDMRKLHTKTFWSWIEKDTKGNPHRAIALCKGTWFNAAINTCRDGDMGELDENGVYERIWYEDDIYNAEVEDVRLANKEEVELYLKYWPLEKEVSIAEYGCYTSDKIVAIVCNGDATDVIYEEGHATIRKRIRDWWYKNILHKQVLPF